MMDKIAIIGAGLMGHGLALVFARGGHEVVVTDAFVEARASVRSRVAVTLASLGDAPEALDRITVADTLPQAVRDADIVIEAAPEKLALKQDLFAELEAAARPDALLASNTSVIPIGQIAARVASKHRVLGTHWWNPPYLVPLVEVIETQGTAPETVQRMMVLLGQNPSACAPRCSGICGQQVATCAVARGDSAGRGRRL
jgi:3-hydroxybutyryl-CoA dehydrogenase